MSDLSDETAFEVLFKENFSTLCSWCQFKFSFDSDTAKEAVHSGFIKLWENRHKLSTDLSAKSFLYTIVNNICLDMLRHEKIKEKYAKFIVYSSSSKTDHEAFVKHDLNQLSADIDKALLELPEQMRLIFELSRNEGLKYAEIADKLNISIKTVETQMSRALAKLRQKLSRYLIITGIIIMAINLIV